MIDDEQLQDVADELAGVRGVVGVLLGGSRARGEHTPDSDVDLGLYYRPPLDVAGLQDLAIALAGPTARVTSPGEWGPWVDGGGWLRIADTPVDWIYRDVDRVQAAWAAARAGRYTFHAQMGHPLGVPDFAYAGEVALGVILADPSGELADHQRATREYPGRLSESLVAGLDEAAFAVEIARKAVSRADASYVAGCLFRVVVLCAHALHGHAGRWLINEKGAVTAAGRLPNAPPDFSDRGHEILGALGRHPEDLDRSITTATALLADTTDACRLDA
jgi:Nucleotidyltransferase domain